MPRYSHFELNEGNGGTDAPSCAGSVAAATGCFETRSVFGFQSSVFSPQLQLQFPVSTVWLQKEKMTMIFSEIRTENSCVCACLPACAPRAIPIGASLLLPCLARTSTTRLASFQSAQQNTQSCPELPTARLSGPFLLYGIAQYIMDYNIKNTQLKCKKESTPPASNSFHFPPPAQSQHIPLLLPPSQIRPHPRMQTHRECLTPETRARCPGDAVDRASGREGVVEVVRGKSSLMETR